MKCRALLSLLVFTCFCVVALAPNAFAQERKDAVDIDTDAMTSQTQFSAPCGADHMNLIWVIPIEFWKAAFAQDPSMTPQQRAEIIGALEEFVIFGVVQADISNLGAFNFYSESEVRGAVKLSFTDANGNARAIKLADTIPPDAQALLGAMKPILTAAMGNMGQNFHFLVVKDEDGQGGRAWDPFAFGKLSVGLQSRDGKALNAELDSPVDALYVPRKCPNGKDAHVTWKFCPWTGQELK